LGQISSAKGKAKELVVFGIRQYCPQLAFQLFYICADFYWSMRQGAFITGSNILEVVGLSLAKLM
jgi:hypothetical protein